MRILLASYAYPPSIGGVERQSQRLARALVERGHSVHVITAEVAGAPSEEIDGGITIERVAAGRGSRWAKMATYIAAMSAATVRRRDHIDVIQIQQALYPAAAMAVVARAIGKPLVVRNSGSGEHGAVQLMSRLPLGSLGLALVRRFATAVSLSPEMTAEMRERGFAKLVEIPNGVELPVVMDRALARRELGLSETAKIVLYVGRLDREKGTRLLAEAWPFVTNAELVVVGDGPESALLDGLPRVHRAGAISDVSTYYAAADVFVLPSESEGISNALLEAMAAGLAVVATDVGGNRAVVSSAELGTLVPRDPHALARALDHPRPTGASARAWIASQWSFAAMVDAYERLYERLNTN